MPTTVNRTDTFDQWRVKTNTISTDVGDLSLLDALIVDDDSIVEAVNELQSDIGDIADLETAATDLVEAVNEVKASVVSFATSGIVAGTGVSVTSPSSGVFTVANSDRGSSQNIFKTIAIAGQSNIEADSNTDTLTVTAGSGISLATNASTDTLTITNTISAANNGEITITAGSGMTGGGSFTTNQSSPATITVTNNDRGSSQNIFKNIVVAGQSTIVADSNDDSLTVAAVQVDTTTGIILTTNATTDTLSISHADTSTQATVGVVSRRYITGVTLDTYGHVTALSTGSESVVSANNGTLTLGVSGTGISGSASFTADQSGDSTFTVTSNATSSNTNSTIVARDGSGGFSAGAVSATTLAATASTLIIPGGGSGGSASLVGSILQNQATGNLFNYIGQSDTRNLAIGWTYSGTAADASAVITTYNRANKLTILADNIILGTGTSNDFHAQLLSNGRSRFGGGTDDAVGTLQSAGKITDSIGDVRSIPQNSQGAYTLVAADNGKHILATGTITIPTDVFAAGQVVCIVNNTTGNITIAQGASTTVYLAGVGTTGNRTLALRGVATVICTASNTFTVIGGGLS
jgi:hypothetical protein